MSTYYTKEARSMVVLIVVMEGAVPKTTYVAAPLQVRTGPREEHVKGMG